MQTLTAGMSDAEIVEFAKTRPEFPWQWGIRLNTQETNDYCTANGLTPVWGDPVRSGDFYIARRNTGYKLLTCRNLGDACVYPQETAYPFDFSECVKVV